MTQMAEATMARRWTRSAQSLGVKLAAGAAALVALVATRPAEAQEIQLTGKLKGAAAVKQLRLYRQGRLELAPTVSFTLLDEYRRTILTGARIQYNLRDWIGVGLWGAYGAVSLATDLTDQIDQRAPRDARTAANVGRSFNDQTAKIQWVAAPQVQLVPFRGKLAIFNSIFVDTDAYFHLGAAFVGLQERGDCARGGATPCDSPGSFTLQSRTAIAPTFGLGLSFYASDLVSIGLEYRALPFAWNRAGFNTRGAGNDAKFPDDKVDSQDQTFKFNQMVTLSVGIFPQKRQTSE